MSFSFFFFSDSRERYRRRPTALHFLQRISPFTNFLRRWEFPPRIHPWNSHCGFPFSSCLSFLNYSYSQPTSPQIVADRSFLMLSLSASLISPVPTVLPDMVFYFHIVMTSISSKLRWCCCPSFVFGFPGSTFIRLNLPPLCTLLSDKFEWAMTPYPIVAFEIYLFANQQYLEQILSRLLLLSVSMVFTQNFPPPYTM